ncbi:MAG: discoidin domain-containing protein [Actinomycetota bacterium]|nr:discoidin domain-containing protein [Actinomycetota bacterium]
MRKFNLIIVMTALGLVLVACSTTSTDGVIRPFEEVQANEMVFENDPTFPGRGIFRVETTEPMICAIVWGETEDLGRFNNSLNMNGTGIIDHDVFLPDAEPGVEYFYRVQGSTADGTFYQSELMTFVLPEPEASGGSDDMVVHGDNLAPAATIAEVSSEFSSSWAAGNAIDDDLNTEWSSAGDGDDAFITIDLGAAMDVAGVEFLTRTMTDGSATTTTFYVVVDGGDRLGPFNAGNPADPSFNAAEFSGQVLRFEVESTTGGNTGAIEIRVFAPAGTGMGDS